MNDLYNDIWNILKDKKEGGAEEANKNNEVKPLFDIPLDNNNNNNKKEVDV